MSVLALFDEPYWDAPFFKQLAHNDTGAAAGHQGGIVIPKDLRPYFPALNPSTSAACPTTDTRIQAVLMDGTKVLGAANTRYQFQTWGGTRPAESRLTDGLAELRNRAIGGDYLVLQRDRESLSHYRLTLVRRASAAGYSEVAKLAAGKRWGVLGSAKPLREDEYQQACSEELEKEAQPFSLFDVVGNVSVTTQRRMARSLAFRTRVQSLYSLRCCVCGASMLTPEGQSEIEAAHIVPRHLSGADDARNGLALCRRHHWAFDRGLFGVSGQARTVIVPQRVQSVPSNAELRTLSGRSISEASNMKLLAHADALNWHIANIVGRYTD